MNSDLIAMLVKKPIGADEKSTALWEATNPMTFEIHTAFFNKVSPDVTFSGTEASDDAACDEWEEGDCKFQGTRKADAVRHGIVRTIGSNCIE